MKWPIIVIVSDQLLGFIVAMTCADNVLSQSPLLMAYVHMVAFVFPIEHYVSRSNFGDMARLYNAIVWPMLPLYFVIVWNWLKGRQGKDPAPLFRIGSDFTVSTRILLIVLSPLWLLIGCAGVVYMHGGDTRLVNFGTSRVQLAMLGWLMPFASAAGFATGLGSIKKAISGII
jgi:hypothetical protein